MLLIVVRLNYMSALYFSSISFAAHKKHGGVLVSPAVRRVTSQIVLGHVGAPAAHYVRRGFFRPAECPRRSALRSCYDYILGLCGLMKDVVVEAFGPLRCFAALPRNLAPLWG